MLAEHAGYKKGLSIGNNLADSVTEGSKERQSVLVIAELLASSVRGEEEIYRNKGRTTRTSVGLR